MLTHLFINDMMKTAGYDYYIGVISKAAIHGASHQRTMEIFVITKELTLWNKTIK